MLLGFFEHLRRYRVPVSVRELIDLLSIFSQRLIFADQDEFYFLSRLSLVKDEKYYDRFDQAFGTYFSGLDDWVGVFKEDESEQLRELLARVMEGNEREVASVMREYGEAVAEAKERADREDGEGNAKGEGEGGGEPGSNESESGVKGEQGDGREEGEGDSGEKGEGDVGKEGEGNDGEKGAGLSEDAEAGERTQMNEAAQKKASKVWLEREFADYDPDVELGTRNLKMALRRLRRWVREASDLELDLSSTIRATARNGGFLDIKEVPERRNAVKVLMLLDVGGSMDEHVELCAQLFSAAGSEFKHLEYFYFHNYVYESVWQENERRTEDKLPLRQLLQKFPRDYKLIIVGDADMGRHEISDRGGSVEHFNAEPGEVWMSRLTEQFRSVVWLNPLPESRWRDSASIQLAKRLVDNQMYFLSDKGLESAMKYLMR
jgi:uncharacterized protein with von Willebrand factor type A (vWA) domain|tara:strand:- start:953 stop:2254 length:1302 start_codon:yes stop_codon:yes gene_type:complete